MNFKNISSKNSQGSSSSRKSSHQSEEIAKLQNEIEILTGDVSALKLLLESRDSAIGILAREKEKIYVDLKSIQRSNQKLYQQLLDEREMHSKSKEYLFDNKQLSKSTENSDTPRGVEDQYVNALKNDISSKDQVILTLCGKYLKLKNYKRVLQNKFKALQRNCEEVCQNVMKTLREHKNSVDTLLDELTNSTTTSPSQEEYIKLVKMNNDLQFENTQLKLYQVSNIYLGDSSKQEHSNIYSPGPSSQNVQKKNEFDYEELHSLFTKHTCRSVKKYPFELISKNYLAYSGIFNDNNLRKSTSDSVLHRDFYR